MSFELNIALDVDGVLLNTGKRWIKKYNTKYHTNYTMDILDSWDAHSKLGISKNEFFKILGKVAKETLTVEPCFELAPYYLFLLKDNNVDIVTGSVAKEKLIKQRLHDLHIRQGIEYKKFIQLSPNKKDAKLDLGYDIYIDDNPLLAEEIDSRNGKTYQILVSQPWNKYYQPKRNVMRAYNWEEILEGVGLYSEIFKVGGRD